MRFRSQQTKSILVSLQGEQIPGGGKRCQSSGHVRKFGQVGQGLDVRLQILSDGVHLVQLVPVELQSLFGLSQEVFLGGQEVGNHLADLPAIDQLLLQPVVVAREQLGGFVHLETDTGLVFYSEMAPA